MLIRYLPPRDYGRKWHPSPWYYGFMNFHFFNRLHAAYPFSCIQWNGHPTARSLVWPPPHIACSLLLRILHNWVHDSKALAERIKSIIYHKHLNLAEKSSKIDPCDLSFLPPHQPEPERLRPTSPSKATGPPAPRSTRSKRHAPSTSPSWETKGVRDPRFVRSEIQDSRDPRFKRSDHVFRDDHVVGDAKPPLGFISSENPKIVKLFCSIFCPNVDGF